MLVKLALSVALNWLTIVKLFVYTSSQQAFNMQKQGIFEAIITPHGSSSNFLSKLRK